jgi:CBS-domain-containing membrane protein
MAHEGRLSDIMTTDLMTLSADTIMTEVDQVFKNRTIHHLPVVDEQRKVVGMVSRTDYYRILHGITLFKNKQVESYNDQLMRSLLVKEVMTSSVVCLRKDSTIQAAADLFKENLFHAIPIVDHDETLVGIVTTYDLLAHAYH